jgi:hypothetical protein
MERLSKFARFHLFFLGLTQDKFSEALWSCAAGSLVCTVQMHGAWVTSGTWPCSKLISRHTYSLLFPADLKCIRMQGHGEKIDHHNAK